MKRKREFFWGLLIFISPCLAQAGERLRLLDWEERGATSFVLDLHWPGRRAQELEMRLTYSPQNQNGVRYVILARGTHLKYFGTSSDYHLYRMELPTFPPLPLQGEGEAEVTIFARGKVISPLKFKLWPSGDEHRIMVSPGKVRLILDSEQIND